ncbi:MAG TPA: DNA topoisomerase IB [Burkholderiales bacterium]|nr:DNA topoisomerase IB [Burkholderiales bacterium]
MPNGNSYTRPGVLEPQRSAEVAGLRYVAGDRPGIRRRGAGKAFRYFAADGSPVTDDVTLRRIRALAIPPAWRDVWICPSENGHLQATGRDARGRKQYRYHRRWREARDDTKYGRMLAFARALPAIRRQVGRDLARPGLPREKVLAALVRLLETTYMRVGNAEYARENESYGLTTLRERQVRVRGSTLEFRFRGKSGVEHDIALTDARLARMVRRMQDLPGEELFRYVNGDGTVHSVESADVNAYLRSIAGEAFTSKDFRTWAGTVLCARELRGLAPPRSAAESRRELAHAVAAVAGKLGNTKAVCRKCYVHPAVIESYERGELRERMSGRSEQAGVVAVLRAQLRRDALRAARSGAGGRPLAPVLARSIARLQRAAPA